MIGVELRAFKRSEELLKRIGRENFRGLEESIELFTANIEEPKR